MALLNGLECIDLLVRREVRERIAESRTGLEFYTIETRNKELGFIAEICFEQSHQIVANACFVCSGKVVGRN